MSPKSKNEYPRTVEEAVNKIMSDLPVQDKLNIADMTEDGLLNLHFSLGMEIRNEFGLWKENSELLESCKTISEEKHIDADTASSIIITSLWERLKKFPPPKLIKDDKSYL